jgi:hypothetical protein
LHSDRVTSLAHGRNTPGLETTLPSEAAERKLPGMKNGANHVPRNSSDRIELGQYIVADPEICHGKPTFKGTRIMVWQVLDDVADGRSWEFICGTRWGGRICLAAVSEAIRLSRQSWLDQRGRLARRPISKRAELAAA